MYVYVIVAQQLTVQYMYVYEDTVDETSEIRYVRIQPYILNSRKYETIIHYLQARIAETTRSYGCEVS
jgi:hypothetical protein